MWLEEHLRHRAGFGVHSPMLYRIVREAMMPRKIKGADRGLYEALMARGVCRRTAVRMQNLYSLEGFTAWKIDEVAREGELAIATLSASKELTEEMVAACRNHTPSTLCILHPVVGGGKRRALCREILQSHPSMSASKPSLTLLFNRADLHKQHIVI